MLRSGLSLLRDLLRDLGLSVMDAGCAEQLVAIQDRLLIDLDRWWPICRNASLSPWGGFNTWPQFEHRCLCVSFSPGRSIISRPYGA